MGQVLGPDRSGSLQVNSVTQVQLNTSVNGDILATVGGQQFHSTSSLLINSGGTGADGLDTGALSTNQTWYVHYVVSSGVLSLLASLSKTAPTGFTSFLWTGTMFRTNSSSQITLAGTEETLKGEYIEASCSSNTVTVSADTYVDATGMAITLSAGTWLIGYNASILLYRISGSGPQGEIVVTDSSNVAIEKTRCYVNSFDTSTDRALSVSRQTRIIVTATTVYKVRLRLNAAAAVGTITIAATDNTGTLAGTDNSSNIWAFRVA